MRHRSAFIARTKMQSTTRSRIARWSRVTKAGGILVLLSAGMFAQAVPSVDELVNKHMAALGGAEKVHAIQSIKVSGRVIGPRDMEIPVVLYVKAGSMRREMTALGKSLIEAFDGTDLWRLDSITGSGEPKKGSEAELQRARDSDEGGLMSDLAEYKAKGATLELTGNDDVRGRPAYKLKYVSKHGYVKYIDLDAETFLECKSTTARRESERDTGHVVYPSDYRPEAGIMMPHSLEMENEGAAAMKMVLDKIETNVPMDDSLFKFPAVSAASAPPESLAKIPPGALVVRVTQNGYEPARLEFPANKSVTIAFTRESASGCGTEVMFPTLKIRKALPLGETVLVDLPPQPIGEIGFSCGMGMLRGTIVAR